MNQSNNNALDRVRVFEIVSKRTENMLKNNG